MDIVVSVDEATGQIAVDGEPVEDIRMAMQAVMGRVAEVTAQTSPMEDMEPAEELEEEPMEEPMEEEEYAPGAPDEAAMMEAFGRGSQM